MAKKNVAMLFVLGQEYIRHDDENYVRNLLQREELENAEASSSDGTAFNARASTDFYRANSFNASTEMSLPDNLNLKYSAEMNSVFEQISNCYIPLLNMFESLERDGIPFKVTLVITPVLCTLLSDAVVQSEYISWLDNKIALGNKELARCGGNKALYDNAKLTLEKIQEDKIDFVEIYGRNLLKAFAEWQQKGFVELFATVGTPVFLPHFADLEEVVNAQVETGLKAHRYFFGDKPDGFWLPEMGYSEGIEKILHAYGVEYTVLDAQSVLFAETKPATGIFSPMSFENSVGILARADELDDLIFGDDGYVGKSVYCAKNRDVGFYLDSEALLPLVKSGASRFTTGFCYWNKSRAIVEASSVGDPVNGDVYDIEKAMTQCDSDASDFVSYISDKLDAAEKVLQNEDSLSVVCALDMARLSENWDECVSWIERVFRNTRDKSIKCKCCGEIVNDKIKLQKIKPYYGAWCGSGYGENFLSGANSWMMRYVRKASERMIDLAERFPSDTGLKVRLLNLGAKELMLAQSCGWAQMIDGNKFADYAKNQFSHFVLSFTTVFDSLGSNSVSTEWLTKMEMEHPIFPWMNYRIFSKKR